MGACPCSLVAPLKSANRTGSGVRVWARPSWSSTTECHIALGAARKNGRLIASAPRTAPATGSTGRGSERRRAASACQTSTPSTGTIHQIFTLTAAPSSTPPSSGPPHPAAVAGAQRQQQPAEERRAAQRFELGEELGVDRPVPQGVEQAADRGGAERQAERPPDPHDEDRVHGAEHAEGEVGQRERRRVADPVAQGGERREHEHQPGRVQQHEAVVGQAAVHQRVAGGEVHRGVVAVEPLQPVVPEDHRQAREQRDDEHDQLRAPPQPTTTPAAELRRAARSQAAERSRSSGSHGGR